MQKDLEFSRQNCGAGDFLKFWAILEGKTPLKRPKKRDFQKIGLILAQKWKRMNQMSTQPFWGVFREVFGVRFYIGALEVPFIGTFAKSARFQVPKNGTSSAPN